MGLFSTTSVLFAVVMLSAMVVAQEVFPFETVPVAIYSIHAGAFCRIKPVTYNPYYNDMLGMVCDAPNMTLATPMLACQANYSSLVPPVTTPPSETPFRLANLWAYRSQDQYQPDEGFCILGLAVPSFDNVNNLIQCCRLHSSFPYEQCGTELTLSTIANSTGLSFGSKITLYNSIGMEPGPLAIDASLAGGPGVIQANGRKPGFDDPSQRFAVFDASSVYTGIPPKMFCHP